MDNTKLYKLFTSFICDIINVFPEYKERLDKYYGDLLLDDTLENNNDKIKEFLENLELYNDKICDKDETLFNSDPIIIPNISFKVIWDSNISNNTKEKIWKYLQSFYMMKLSSESNEILKDLDIYEKIKDKDTIRKMKKLKKLNESLKEEYIETNQSNQSNQSEDILPNIESILNNTNIGKIAKEITEEINIDEMVSGNNIGDMFKGENMMNLFSVINNKIGSKLNTNDLNKNDLVNEATNICNTMQDNDLFNSILNNETMKNIKIPGLNENEMTNPTKERLKKKLKQKQKQKSKEIYIRNITL